MGLLLDRLERTSDPAVAPYLPVHEFSDSLMLWAEGELSRAQIVNFWSLTAPEEVELDALAAAYAASTATEKLLFGDKFVPGQTLKRIGAVMEGAVFIG